MLPRWHIFWGAVFSLILYLVVPGIEWYYLIIVFLSSFLIDFDHYMAAAYNSGKISLFESFKYYDIDRIKAMKEKKKGIRNKGTFHLFHTVEFHFLVFILGLFFAPLFYVFIGMMFHTLLDLLYLAVRDVLYRREFLLWNWIKSR